jgi:L-rhamnose-H+ transport protein
MASSILFGSLLGIWLGEWKGTSARARSLLFRGLTLLVASTIIAGYSGYLGEKAKKKAVLPGNTAVATVPAVAK